MPNLLRCLQTRLLLLLHGVSDDMHLYIPFGRSGACRPSTFCIFAQPLRTVLLCFGRRIPAARRRFGSALLKFLLFAALVDSLLTHWPLADARGGGGGEGRVRSTAPQHCDSDV